MNTSCAYYKGTIRTTGIQGENKLGDPKSLLRFSSALFMTYNCGKFDKIWVINPCRRFYPIMEKYSINSTSQCYGWLFPFHRCYLTLRGFNAFWRIFLQTILPGHQDLCLKLKSNSKKVCMNKMLSALTFP